MRTFNKKKVKRVYKKTKKTKSQELPRNYRFIPENLNSDGFTLFVGVLFIIASIFVLSLDLYANYKNYKSLKNEKIRVLSDLNFWQNEVKTKPNYRDGYFKLALVNYQLKNLNEANSNLEKALKLDPNFEKGRELQKILNNL